MVTEAVSFLLKLLRHVGENRFAASLESEETRECSAMRVL